MFKISIRTVVAATDENRPIIAVFTPFLRPYIKDAIQAKVAEERKFITNPYSPVSLTDINSINTSMLSLQEQVNVNASDISMIKEDILKINKNIETILELLNQTR